MELFLGLSAFPITPADETGVVNLTDLDRLLERLLVPGIASIGLLGSTGTYAYLNRAQRLRAIEAAVELVNGKLPVIAGTGALRTDDAIGLSQDAERAGADGLLIAPVSYTPLTQDEAFEHYRAIAAQTSVPICIYNNPSTTHFQFTSGLIQRLAAIPSVQAIKMPLPAALTLKAEIDQLRQALPREFRIGYSGDWGCPDALLQGADCWFSVISGILPIPAAALATAAQARNTTETERLNQQFQGLWALFKEFGGLRVAYAIAQILEITKAKPPKPVLPLNVSAEGRVRDALAALHVQM